MPFIVTVIPITPGSGVNLDATQVVTVSGNVLREVTVIGDPQTAGSIASVSTSGALRVESAKELEVAFSTTAVAMVGTTDANGYGGVSVQLITNGGASNNAFECSNDGANWSPMFLTRTSDQISYNVATNPPAIYYGPLLARYFRINITGISSGTTSGLIAFFSDNTTQLVLPAGLQSLATVAKQPQPGTAGSASIDVITVQGKAAMTPILVDGTATTQPTNITQMNSVAVSMNTGNVGTGVQRVVIATDQAQLTNPLKVTDTPATSGGTTVATGSATGAISIKASAGQLYGLMVYNGNTTPVYMQIFNTLVGSVTLGTTAPVMSIGLGPGVTMVRDISKGIAFSTAIVIAFTSSRAGLPGPANTVDYNVEYA